MEEVETNERQLQAGNSCSCYRCCSRLDVATIRNTRRYQSKQMRMMTVKMAANCLDETNKRVYS